MEERIRERAEDYLDGRLSGAVDPIVDRLLENHPADRSLLDQFAEQALLIRKTLRGPEMSPPPGFYSRVLARIQAEDSQATFWSIFTGTFGQRLVYASAALLVLMGVAMWTTDGELPRQEFAEAPVRMLIDDRPEVHLVGEQFEDRGRVFVSLASYDDFQ